MCGLGFFVPPTKEKPTGNTPSPQTVTRQNEN